MKLYRVVSIYALLAWGYCCARLLMHPEYMSDPFIMGIPVTFWQFAMGTFIVSFFAEVIGCLYEYRCRPKSP